MFSQTIVKKRYFGEIDGSRVPDTRLHALHVNIIDQFDVELTIHEPRGR